MYHGDKPARRSKAASGEIADKPERMVSFVVTDEDDEPAGVLEKWSDEAWIFAEKDALRDIN